MSLFRRVAAYFSGAASTEGWDMDWLLPHMVDIKLLTTSYRSPHFSTLYTITTPFDAVQYHFIMSQLFKRKAFQVMECLLQSRVSLA